MKKSLILLGLTLFITGCGKTTMVCSKYETVRDTSQCGIGYVWLPKPLGQPEDACVNVYKQCVEWEAK